MSQTHCVFRCGLIFKSAYLQVAQSSWTSRNPLVCDVLSRIVMMTMARGVSVRVDSRFRPQHPLSCTAYPQSLVPLDNNFSVDEGTSVSVFGVLAAYFRIYQFMKAFVCDFRGGACRA